MGYFWFAHSFPTIISYSGVVTTLVFGYASLLVCFLVLFVVSFVIHLLLPMFYSEFFVFNGFNEKVLLEVVWTLIPPIMLFCLAVPSFTLLYNCDLPHLTGLNINVVGHQWYWGYEYSNYNLEFDSYMVPLSGLEPGDFRLLEVDNRTVVPVNSWMQYLVTSEDVIHSWAMPPLCLNVDAIPGKLVGTNSNIEFTGLYFGQCSEICGVNHSFIPISLEGTTGPLWQLWVLFNLDPVSNYFICCDPSQGSGFDFVTNPESALVNDSNLPNVLPPRANGRMDWYRQVWAEFISFLSQNEGVDLESLSDCLSPPLSNEEEKFIYVCYFLFVGIVVVCLTLFPQD